LPASSGNQNEKAADHTRDQCPIQQQSLARHL
jgi:hypothetical protein